MKPITLCRMATLPHHQIRLYRSRLSLQQEASRRLAGKAASQMPLNQSGEAWGLKVRMISVTIRSVWDSMGNTLAESQYSPLPLPLTPSP